MTDAFDLQRVAVHVALGQTEVFMTASVVEDIHVVVYADDDEHSILYVELARNPALVIVQFANLDGLHGVTTFTVAKTDVTSRSTSSANFGGRFASIS